ncbi:MAG: DNA double-strand break repair nuclease NurA [Candidatus Aenigmatarchaeota archaeon]
MKELKEAIKRAEFNLTEPEVLVRLINSAKREGEKIQKEFKRMNSLVGKLNEEISKKMQFFFTEPEIESEEIRLALGVDGSNQIIRGIGSKWYVFLSVAGVIFVSGRDSPPKVDIFWADIEEFDESKNPFIKRSAEIKMLSIESKAILEYGTKNSNSVIFIDGPIVDPPFKYENHDAYVEFRCNAIKKCIESNSILIGCVKRVRDKFFINYLLQNNIKDVREFPTDQHLMLMLFTRFRSQEKVLGPLYTKWIDVTNLCKEYTLPYDDYEKNGIFVISFFYERDIKSKILRIDVPLNFSPLENPVKVENIVSKVVKTLNYWTYPSQDPLPVLLAHEKCNIRKGAAEVLYEEIITRSMSLEPSDQIIAAKMR